MLLNIFKPECFSEQTLFNSKVVIRALLFCWFSKVKSINWDSCQNRPFSIDKYTLLSSVRFLAHLQRITQQELNSSFFFRI